MSANLTETVDLLVSNGRHWLYVFMYDGMMGGVNLIVVIVVNSSFELSMISTIKERGWLPLYPRRAQRLLLRSDKGSFEPTLDKSRAEL